MLGVFVVLITVYAWTAPLAVMLEDDGEFVMVARYVGVAHPPGYPLFALVAHPFTWLPFGSVAFRVHLASAFFAAAACAILWWVVRALVPRTSAAWVAALALGLSSAFWSQAIIAEVYSLNVLLFVSMLAVALAYLDTHRPALLLVLSLLLGLGLANHWPLFVLAVPCLALVLLPARGSLFRQAPRLALPGLLLLALGLSPYAWMYLRSQTASEVAFAGAIETWNELVYYVTRGPYADATPTAGWSDRLRLGGFLVREALVQVTPLGAALAAVGAFAPRKGWTRPLSLGLLVGFLATPIGLLLMRDVDYDLQARAITRVFPLVSYLVLAVWLGAGYDRVIGIVRSNAGSRWKVRAAAAGLGALVVGATFAVGLRRNDRRHDDFAHAYATAMLSSFEPDATVFLQHDFDTFPMQYLHFVEGVRPDVRLLHNTGQSIALDGRPFGVGAGAVGSPAERMDRVIEFVEETDGPVYFTAGAPPSLSDFDYGLYKKVDRSSAGRTTWLVDERLLAFFRRVLATSTGDDEVLAWARDFLIRRMTPVLAALVEVPPVSADLAERFGPDLDAASHTLPGLLARIAVLERRVEGSAERRLEMALRAEGMEEAAVSKAQRAQIRLHKGRALRELGRTREAAEAFERSIAIFPHPANDAYAERAAANR